MVCIKENSLRSHSEVVPVRGTAHFLEGAMTAVPVHFGFIYNQLLEKTGGLPGSLNVHILSSEVISSPSFSQ